MEASAGIQRRQDGGLGQYTEKTRWVPGTANKINMASRVVERA